jgi:hypothetical protein
MLGPWFISCVLMRRLWPCRRCIGDSEIGLLRRRFLEATDHDIVIEGSVSLRLASVSAAACSDPGGPVLVGIGTCARRQSGVWGQWRRDVQGGGAVWEPPGTRA